VLVHPTDEGLAAHDLPLLVHVGRPRQGAVHTADRAHGYDAAFLVPRLQLLVGHFQALCIGLVGHCVAFGLQLCPRLAVNAPVANRPRRDIRVLPPQRSARTVAGCRLAHRRAVSLHIAGLRPAVRRKIAGHFNAASGSSEHSPLLLRPHGGRDQPKPGLLHQVEILRRLEVARPAVEPIERHHSLAISIAKSRGLLGHGTAPLSPNRSQAAAQLNSRQHPYRHYPRPHRDCPHSGTNTLPPQPTARRTTATAGELSCWLNHRYEAARRAIPTRTIR
jgi:hypothetical protein